MSTVACLFRHRSHKVLLGAMLLLLSSTLAGAQSTSEQPEVNDVHFHLTNYIQQGTDIHAFLDIMGTKVGRVALFGIPLQQQWSYANSGDFAPTYYLQTDAPLYCYSFTDAYIAMAYRSLTPEQRARFDPMITGFDPADMYAVDHIRPSSRHSPAFFRELANSPFTKSLFPQRFQEERPVSRIRL